MLPEASRLLTRLAKCRLISCRQRYSARLAREGFLVPRVQLVYLVPLGLLASWARVVFPGLLVPLG